MEKPLIEAQKPKLFLDRYKPKKIQDLKEIEKIINPKEFPKYQKKINFKDTNKINKITIDKKNKQKFRRSPKKFLQNISKMKGWILFVYPSPKSDILKIKKNQEIFDKFRKYPYIFGKTTIKEKSYNFDNLVVSYSGLLVRKEIYDEAGKISLKFFDLDLALFDLIRKLSKLFFMMDLNKCGFGITKKINKRYLDLEFERDLYASLEREPLQASIYDKYILEN